MSAFSNRRFLKAAAVLALCGVALSLLGALVVWRETRGGPRIERVAFDTRPYDSPPRRVSGLLFLPEEPASNPAPAVIFLHGMTVQKETYVSQCVELAGHGLVVLAIDLRGHGETGGSYSFGETEMRDAWAAADYLAGLEQVDPEKIGVAGHSLGGITATRAGIFQEDGKIEAVAAIYCWPGQKEAVELVFGSLDGFIGRLWPFLAISRVYDINDQAAQRARDVAGSVSTSSPPDFLLVIGDGDQLGSVEQARQIMKNATGRGHVAANTTYGSFADGTARRLEVTGDDHATEATSTAVLDAVASWMFESFGLRPPDTVRNTSIRRYAGWSAILWGLALVAAGSVFLLRAFRREERGRGDIAPYRPDGRKAGRWLGATAALLFCAASVAALPFAKASGIRAFVPFFGVDAFASIALSRAVLLVPCALALHGLTRLKRWKPLAPGARGAERTRRWRGLGTAGFSALLGSAPVALFAALYAPTAHCLHLPGAVPVSAGWFALLSAVLAVQLWVEQEYLHYFFMPAFAPCETTARRLGYILAEAAVRGVAFGLAFLPVLSNPFQLIGRPGLVVRFPALPTFMALGLMVFLPASALAFYARRRGYNVIAPCLALALSTALMFSSFFSSRAF